MRQIAFEDPKPTRRHNPAIPLELDTIILKALEKNPADRYPTWADFALELAKLGGLSVYQQAIPDSKKFSDLRALAMLKPFSDADIWELVHASSWQRLPAHHAIIHEGEAGESLYLLTRGEVKVTKHARLLNVLRAGECFGEMSYVKGSGTPRQATVESLTEVVIAEFSRDAIEKHVDAACRLNLVLALLNTLVDRLTMANARISRIIN